MSSSTVRFDRLLLTGAAGGLGRQLRPRLKTLCRVLRVSDVADLGTPAEGEELAPAALQDAAAMLALLDGVEAVVHLGGVSVEGPFEPILQANIVGVHNLYEAVRKHGARRGLTATTASPRRSARACRASTSTATASRRSACASARRSPNRRTAACSPPG
jgi:uronate dehydrogenase